MTDTTTDPTSSDEPPIIVVPRWLTGRRLELVAVIVMSLTAVLTAWSGFQSAQWSAIQAGSYGEAAGEHTESVRASNEASQNNAVDLAVFIAWLDAQANDDLETADFIYQRFPDRLKVASDAWLALDPFENPDAPGSPFDMEEYVVPAAERAAEMEQAAEEHTVAAQHATERANEFVLMTVLFATVLFFASISGKLTSNHNRAAILAVALIGLVAGILILLTYPSAPGS